MLLQKKLYVGLICGWDSKKEEERILGHLWGYFLQITFI